MYNTAGQKKLVGSTGLLAPLGPVFCLADLVLSMSQACHPDVDNRACTSIDDCFSGERCVTGVCEAIETDDTGSDSVGDGHGDRLADPPTDPSDDSVEAGHDGDGGSTDSDETEIRVATHLKIWATSPTVEGTRETSLTVEKTRETLP